MTLISLMSAKGAPGTTTTAMLLANLWPAPTIVVDADPLGGDIALRIPGERGPMDPSVGLMSLLPAARRGLESHTVLTHAQDALGGQPVIAGLPGPEQAVAVAPLWQGLAHAFARVPGHDVFADVGQVNARSGHIAMLENSSALICVFRPTAWSAIHTRRRLESLEDTLRQRRVEVGIVCVATTAQAADAKTAAGSIINELAWVKDYGVIANDPATVVIYEGGEVFRPERSLLARSGHQVAQKLYAELGPASAAAPAATELSDRKQRGRGWRPKRGGVRTENGSATGGSVETDGTSPATAGRSS